MNDTPPKIEASPPVPSCNKFHQMARASWLAPLIGILANLFLVVGAGGNTPGTSNSLRALISVVFIGGGLILGIVALFGISNYGRKRILVPALVGIGINLFLIVMGTLPLLYLAKKRANFQPVVHLASARLLTDDRLRFSMDIPEGFKDFPEGKRTPKVEHVFIKEIPDGGQARMVITIERLNGILARNQPMVLEDIRKRFPPGVTVELAEKNWRGLRVDAIVAEMPQNDIRMVVCTIQVPLVPSAVQLGVAGPESKRAEVEQLADALLASLEGNTNW